MTTFDERLADELRKRAGNAPEARILTLDIERFPALAGLYDLRTTYVPHTAVVAPSRMCCLAAKWLGSDEVIFLAEYDFERGRITKRARTDMLKRAWDLIDQADAVVSFNGNRFDLPHLTTEFTLAGMREPRPVKSIDLYAVGRKRLRFESNSLAYMCRRLGLPAKGSYGGMEAMYGAMSGEPAVRSFFRHVGYRHESAQTVWERLRDYNAQDILSTEALYLRMQGHNPGHPMLGPVADGLRCNQCKGTDLEPAGWNRAVVQDRAQYRCTTCGGYLVTSFYRRVATTRGVA